MDVGKGGLPLSSSDRRNTKQTLPFIFGTCGFGGAGGRWSVTQESLMEKKSATAPRGGTGPYRGVTCTHHWRVPTRGRTTRVLYDAAAGSESDGQVADITAGVWGELT